MSKTMAEVLTEHYEFGFDPVADRWECRCDHPLEGDRPDYLHIQHQAAALSAAGFGSVADAKGEALEEAAEALEVAPYETLDCGAVITEWRDALNVNHGIQAATRFIRGSAAAVRGEG